MGFKIALLLLALASCCGSVSITTRCGSDRFFNADTGKCTACLVCTGNQIPRRVCHDDVDTVCGPLPRFHFLHPQNPPKTTENSVQIPENPDKTSDLPTTSTVSVSDKWYTITIVLGILVLVCIAGVITMIVFRVLTRRKRDREIICKAEYSPCSRCAWIALQPSKQRPSTRLYSFQSSRRETRDLENNVLGNTCP